MIKSICFLLCLISFVFATKLGGGLTFEGNPQTFDLLHEMTGDGGWVLIICPGVDRNSQGPSPQCAAGVRAAYDRGLNVVVRIGPQWGHTWREEHDGRRDSWGGLSAAIARVVAGLPVVGDGRNLWIQIHNEPDLCYEWFCANPEGSPLGYQQIATEYAHMASWTIDHIHALGKPQLKVAVAGLAPGANRQCGCCGHDNCGAADQAGVTSIEWLQAMKGAVGNIFDRVDWFASHSYPANGAGYGFNAPLDNAQIGLTWYKRELAAIGRPSGLPVIITETGWNTAGNGGNPPCNEQQKADWLKGAFERYWNPDSVVVGVTNFIFRDQYWGDQVGYGMVRDSNGQRLPVFDAIKSLRSGGPPPPTPPPPAGGGDYLGCFEDRDSRDLNGYSFTSGGMTIESCRAECSRRGFAFAGLQYSSQCFCGSTHGQYGQKSDAECNMPCAGNGGQRCGAAWRNSVWKSGAAAGGGGGGPEPVNAGEAGWDRMYDDMGASKANSAKECEDRCRGTAGCAAWAFSRCSNDGDSYHLCWLKHGLGQRVANQCRVSGTISAPPPPPPQGGDYVGCFEDRDSRDLNGYSFSNGGMTVETCRAEGSRRGFQFAGVQYSSQCFCGNSYGRYGQKADGECNMQCSGNGGEKCGAGWRNSVWKSGSDYRGCFVDDGNRDIQGAVIDSASMTIGTCRRECARRGFSLAGLQYSSQCFCGNSAGRYGQKPDGECNMPCSGDGSQKCGSAWRNSVWSASLSAVQHAVDANGNSTTTRSSGLSGGVVATIVVGTTVVAAAALVTGVLLIRRWRKSDTSSVDTNYSNMNASS